MDKEKSQKNNTTPFLNSQEDKNWLKDYMKKTQKKGSFGSIVVQSLRKGTKNK